VLLILPLAALLVLVLAEPKLVAQAGANDDSAVSAASSRLPVDLSAAPQDKSEKQKKEEKIKQMEQEKKTKEVMKEAQVIQAKIAEVEVSIKKTDDPKKQKELKATLVKLYDKDKKIKTYLNGENGNGEMKKVDYVKLTPEMVDDKIKAISKKLKKTDDLKEQQTLETELKELYLMKKRLESGEEKYVKVAREKVKKEKK